MSGINSKLLSFQRKGLAEMGAPYDVYSLEDIDRVDLAQYKLFVMLTAFELTAEQENVLAQIKNSKEKTILWAYAPGYVNGGLSAVSAHVGMQMTELHQAPEFCGTEGEGMPAPCLAVEDEKAEVLVRFDDGTAAVALKKLDGSTSVYSALGNMSGELLRRIARIAGVHIYCENAPVYVNSSLLGIYNLEKSLVYTRRDGVWEDIFSGEQYISVNGHMHIDKTPNTAKLLIYKEAPDSAPNLGKE